MKTTVKKSHKKVLAVIVAASIINLLPIAHCFAQPTLTSANSPQIGDKSVALLADTVGVTAGPSGAGIMWDFSTLSATGDTAISEVVIPDSTPYSADFPGASQAIKLANGIRYGYYFSNALEYTLLGEVIPNIITITTVYDDPQKLYVNPFTYNSTFSDDFSAESVGGAGFYRTGTITVTADAYGTIQLPTGTFSNVLRLKVIKNFIDSLNIGGIVHIYQAEGYLWFPTDSRWPILSINKMTGPGPTGPTTVRSVSYSASVTSGVNRNNLLSQLAFNVYPNPAKDQTTITYNLNKQAKVKLTLYNKLGQKLKVISDNNQMPGIYEIPLNLGNFNKGVYLIQLMIDGIVRNHKIEIIE